MSLRQRNRGRIEVDQLRDNGQHRSIGIARLGATEHPGYLDVEPARTLLPPTQLVYQAKFFVDRRGGGRPPFARIQRLPIDIPLHPPADRA